MSKSVENSKTNLKVSKIVPKCSVHEHLESQNVQNCLNTSKSVENHYVVSKNVVLKNGQVCSKTVLISLQKGSKSNYKPTSRTEVQRLNSKKWCLPCTIEYWISYWKIMQ